MQTLYYETTGYSMWPFLKPRMRLLLKAIPYNSLSIGSIVLFRQDNQLICHRIIKKKLSDDHSITFYVRGDNSLSKPQIITDNAYKGMVIGYIKDNNVISVITPYYRIYFFLLAHISIYMAFIIRQINNFYNYYKRGIKYFYER